MRILTINVSSVMLSRKMCNPKCYDCKDRNKTKTECREMAPNLPTNRAIHEGGNPLF
jgi:hypothetical protein